MKPTTVFSMFDYEDRTHTYSEDSNIQRNADKFVYVFGDRYSSGFLPELPIDFYDIEGFTESYLVKVHEYVNYCYDGEREWTIVGIYFVDQPLMILQSAGRGGKDYTKRFIVNKEMYVNFIKHVNSLIVFKDHYKKFLDADIVSMDEDVSEIGNFYGDTIENIKKHGELK